MSEDDRATKAARAKALLNKKRQQKKTGAPAVAQVADPIASPSPPASRSYTPAPSEPASQQPETVLPVADGDARDVGELFSKDDADTSWISTLPRVEAPVPTPISAAPTKSPPTRSPPNKSPPAKSQPPAPQSDGTAALEGEILKQRNAVRTLEAEKASLLSELEQLRELQSKIPNLETQLAGEQKRSHELEARIQQLEAENAIVAQNQQQTISLLVAEKASLTADLERLLQVEADALDTSAQLEEQRNQSKSLDERVQELISEAQTTSQRLQDLQSKEKALSDKCRDQERELQIANSSVSKMQAEAAEHQRRVRDLEEQIQSDDRAEKLEESLQHTRDRADELEFQLSKLKQTHQTLKTERDAMAKQLSSLQTTESDLKTKFEDINAKNTELEHQLSSADSEKEVLLKEKEAAQSQTVTLQDSIRELEQKLSTATAELSSSTRQLQAVQAELRNAVRRADEAERTQADLQTEGSNLMRALDEMRPKIVELTGIKLELTEKVELLQRDLETRDSMITELESSVEELRDERDRTAKKLKEAISVQDHDRTDAQKNLAEQQQAYAEQQAELESALASVRTLENERGNQHQEAARRLDEVTQLTKATKSQAEELAALRIELDKRSHEQEEDQDLLDNAQNEIETMREELAAKDAEIQRLQERIDSSIAPSPAVESAGPQSLDGEMLSSLRQQHALDLSAAHSQVRALEDQVFEAQAKAHALQKQVGLLEDQLASSRSAMKSGGGTTRPFSPGGSGVPSRPSSRGLDGHHRNSSLGSMSQLSRPPAASGASAYLPHLSAETRHKRQVSLSMLKARIESEAAAAVVSVSQSPSRGPSPAPHALSVIKEATHGQTQQHPHPLTESMSAEAYRHPRFLDESHIFWCHSCRGDLVVL